MGSSEEVVGDDEEGIGMDWNEVIRRIVCGLESRLMG